MINENMQMEPSLSTLAFKGSITEAVAEAKQQKKLLLVYVEGDNPDSKNLGTLTWVDASVADAVSKFCVLLHIMEGSAEAAYFSAMYPQKSAPCITAVGYNGIRVWQYDGFVTAEVLASSIEKAWLSLHIQETTATYLAAALALKAQSTSGNPEAADDGSSSNTNIVLPVTRTENDSAEVRSLTNNENPEQNMHSESLVEELDSHMVDELPSGSSSVGKYESAVLNDVDSHVDHEVSPTPIDKVQSPDSAEDNRHTEIPTPSSSSAGQYLKQTGGEAHTKNTNLGPLDHQTDAKEVPKEILNEANEVSRTERVGDPVVEQADVSKSGVACSDDVHLNVRLPDGSSLQFKFSIVDTLRKVKDYVDENQTTSLGSYDLAIPYPRKVFTEEDLDRTLLDLNLLNRQTLIVVVHRRATQHSGGVSAQPGQNRVKRDGSSNAGSEGNWAYLRRILSYLNPFSYLTASSTAPATGQTSQNSMRQYSANPSIQNDLRGQGRSSGPYSSDPSGTSSTRNRRGNQPRSSGFGSNIHTLKHDDDDRKFGDRNTFWNGNSTQFGGDSDGK